eukprot:4015035-Ditylum_brightwellii.AAC.1
MKNRIAAFDQKLNECLKDTNFLIADAPDNAFSQDDIEGVQDMDMMEPIKETHAESPDDYSPDVYDQMINAEFLLHEGDSHI